MKKIKKIAASIMAVAAMATSMVGISASAATNSFKSEHFYPGTGTASAELTYSKGTSYTPATRAVSNNIISVSVSWEATTSFSTVYSPVFTGYTYISTNVTSSNVGGTITSFTSHHSASTSSATASKDLTA